MRFFRSFLFAFCVFVLAARCLPAQNLTFTVDSITNKGVNVSDTAVPLETSAADTLTIYTSLRNNDTSAILYSSLSFTAYNASNLLTDTNFVYTFSAGDSLNAGSTGSFILKIFTDPGTPLPSLLPTGSSVVIWPVYFNQSTDSIHFILKAVDTFTAISNVSALYTTVLYSSKKIHIEFNSTTEKIIQLYDALGRKVYEGESNSANADIDWSTLPAGIFILRIKQGDSSESVKLVHF